jgi:hypothetical protein
LACIELFLSVLRNSIPARLRLVALASQLDTPERLSPLRQVQGSQPRSGQCKFTSSVADVNARGVSKRMKTILTVILAVAVAGLVHGGEPKYAIRPTDGFVPDQSTAMNNPGDARTISK